MCLICVYLNPVPQYLLTLVRCVCFGCLRPQLSAALIFFAYPLQQNSIPGSDDQKILLKSTCGKIHIRRATGANHWEGVSIDTPSWLKKHGIKNLKYVGLWFCFENFRKFFKNKIALPECQICCVSQSKQTSYKWLKSYNRIWLHLILCRCMKLP